MTLKAPFPWFGGKSMVADAVWQRFGAVQNYVEPFAGSLAVLLGNPAAEPPLETVNDADGFLCNFWRAVTHDPEQTAHYADWPVNENDLHARHAYLVGIREDFTRRLEGDPGFYDAKVAGWWAWGICCWIGRGWCSGGGPWQIEDRQLVHLGNRGRGVHRQLVHLGDRGRGVHRKLVHLGDRGQGGIYDWFAELSDRLRRVRVCCGDWSRVCGPTVTVKQGVTGVFLDPPYTDVRCPDLYAVDSLTVADDVASWAFENGDDRRMRIALCGYSGEHEPPAGWTLHRWRTQGGYESQRSQHRDPHDLNAAKETIWFSPHCLSATQGELF